jgi:hypothetical protein
MFKGAGAGRSGVQGNRMRTNALKNAHPIILSKGLDDELNDSPTPSVALDMPSIQRGPLNAKYIYMLAANFTVTRHAANFAPNSGALL